MLWLTSLNRMATGGYFYLLTNIYICRLMGGSIGVTNLEDISEEEELEDSEYSSWKNLVRNLLGCELIMVFYFVWGVVKKIICFILYEGVVKKSFL